MAKTCRNCVSRCYLISLVCLYNGANYLNPSLPANKVENAMDQAQQEFLRPMLGDCLTELCAAVKDYEDNGTPIPDKWQAVIDEATNLLIAATEFKYLQRGRVLVSGDGLVSIKDIKSEDWSGFLGGLKAEVNSAQANFGEWLKENASDYTCLPKAKCGDKETPSGFLADWDVIGGNPRIGQKPPYEYF